MKLLQQKKKNQKAKTKKTKTLKSKKKKRKKNLCFIKGIFLLLKSFIIMKQAIAFEISTDYVL
jgi:hypothetical protein